MEESHLFFRVKKLNQVVLMLPGNKDELEKLNNEVKKDADLIRTKLNCEFYLLIFRTFEKFGLL